MHAREIMTTPVITATAEMPVEGVAKLLVDNRISAVPVIDSADRLVGLVSESDLMRRTEFGTGPHHSWWCGLTSTGQERAAEYLKTHGTIAAHVMTRNVLTVEPDTPGSEIAEMFDRHHIKRVPVTANGQILGIVSRIDLVRSLAASRHEIRSTRFESDAKIRENFLSYLRDEGLPVADRINPIVEKGTMHVWGAVESECQRDAVLLAANTIRGVTSVADHLGILPRSVRAFMF